VTPPNGTTAEVAALPAVSPLQRHRGRRSFGTRLALIGPAFVACIAYVDPGNFATNIAGGSPPT
jgi:manganese transport protein